MPTLSIVIVNWNSKEYLDGCLKSIERARFEPEPEIIVVDGGSFDGCDQLLDEKYPDIRFIQSQENLGFGRSNNLGIAAATGDIVALLNPDTEIVDSALRILVDELERLPDAGAVGPKLLNTDKTLQSSCVQAYPSIVNQALDSDFLRHALPKSKLWGTYEAFNNDSPTVVEVISGACIVAKADVLKQTGGFTKDYFMYVEDMDLCKKIKDVGKRVYHVPAAEVVHHGGGSSSTQFSRFSVVMNLESLSLYMKLRHGRSNQLAFRLFMAASSAVRILVLALAKVLRRKIRKNAMQRWIATLSWAIGRESWTREYNISNTSSPQAV